MNNITLTGITWDHPRGYDPLIAASALYERSFGVRIDWQKRSLTDFGDQSLTELAGRFDLLIIDHPHAGVADESNCLVALNDVLTQDELKEQENHSAGPCFSSYNYKGKLWALPIDAAMQCSANRPDLLDRSNVPGSWKEVFELSDSLKKRNLQTGMALCPTDCVCSFLSITAQLGSPVVEGREMLVSREVGLQALELLRKMRNSFHINCLNWNPIALYDYMSANDDVVYSPLAFCYTNYSREGFRKNKLHFGNAPDIKNALLGGAGIAVSAKSKWPVEAARYSAWICSPEIQNTIYVLAQGQPANIVAWKSKYANELTHNFFLNTLDTLTNAFVRPRHSGWPAVQKYFGEVIHGFLKDDSDPNKILDHMQEVYRQSYLDNS